MRHDNSQRNQGNSRFSRRYGSVVSLFARLSFVNRRLSEQSER